MLFLVSLWGEFAGAAKLLTLLETALENVIDNGCANGANEKNYECPKPRRTPKNGQSFPAIDRVAEPLICLFVGACLFGRVKVFNRDLRVKIFSDFKEHPTIFEDDLALLVTNRCHVVIRDSDLPLATAFVIPDG